MHRINIEATTLGERGPRYRVTFANTVLIESSRVPEFDACCALLARGLDGRLEVWRPEKDHPDMVVDIVRGAQLTVEEGDRQSLPGSRHSARGIPSGMGFLTVRTARQRLRRGQAG